MTFSFVTNIGGTTASTAPSRDQGGTTATSPDHGDPSTSGMVQATCSLKRTTSELPMSKKKSAITDYLIKTSAAEKEMLDEEIASMIFATNSPFRLVEHPRFQKLISLLRPGYSPPSRKDIADKVLPTIYDKELKRCADELKERVSAWH